MGAGGLSELASSVGRASGLSGKSVSSMLTLLAPVLFGVLKRAKRMAGPGRFDIADLLARQRTHIGSAGEETYAGSRFGATRDRVAETYTTTEPEHKTSKAAWILPLALLAGGLWLLSNWVNRPRQVGFIPPSTVEAGREEKTTRPRTVLSLEQLKTKYNSVLREAEVQGVRISDLHEQNGKLVFKGTAPSQESASKVWSEIRRVNPAMDEISADIQVVQASPSATQSTLPDESSTRMPALSGDQTYTVQPGDTLRSISQHFYGNPKDYTRIFSANRNKIQNADLIEVGQELSIP